MPRRGESVVPPVLVGTELVGGTQYLAHVLQELSSLRQPLLIAWTVEWDLPLLVPRVPVPESCGQRRVKLEVLRLDRASAQPQRASTVVRPELEIHHTVRVPQQPHEREGCRNPVLVGSSRHLYAHAAIRPLASELAPKNLNHRADDPSRLLLRVQSAYRDQGVSDRFDQRLVFISPGNKSIEEFGLRACVHADILRRSARSIRDPRSCRWACVLRAGVDGRKR